MIADYAKLVAWPNVGRVALGWKESNGRVRRRMSVKIYVRKKVKAPAKSAHLPRWAAVLVPTSKDRYRKVRLPTDVVWHREPTFCAGPGDFLDPILGGAMIGVGVPGRDAGTFACMVRNAAGQEFALTAGHVIQPVVGLVPANVVVRQPPGAAPVPAGASAVLGRTAVGGFFGNTGDDGFRDFALIRLSGRRGTSLALDNVPGNSAVLTQQTVVNGKVSITKFGAVTGRTNASFVTLVPSVTIQGVTAINVYEFLGVGGKLIGQRGDSGALVISTSAASQGSVVGLLFATAGTAPDAPFGRAFVFPFDRITGFRPI